MLKTNGAMMVMWMRGLLFYTLLLAALAAVFMLLRVRFNVAYTRRGTDDNLRVEMTMVYGLIRYTTEVPVVDLDVHLLKPILKVEADLEGVMSHEIEDKGMIVRVPVLLMLRKMPMLLKKGREYLKKYNRALTRLLRSVRCHRLEWTTEVGLGDPAYTGMAAGLIWAGKGLAYRVFRSHVGIMENQPRFAVRPSFNRAYLAVDFNCIFDLRIGHIIIAGLKFVILRFST